jgi:hypothetical protein
MRTAINCASSQFQFATDESRGRLGGVSRRLTGEGAAGGRDGAIEDVTAGGASIARN